MEPADVSRSGTSPIFPTGVQPPSAQHTPAAAAPPNNLRLENEQAVSVSPHAQPSTLDGKMTTIAQKKTEEAQILRRLQENPRAMEAKKKEITEAKEQLSKKPEVKGTLKSTSLQQAAERKVKTLENELTALITTIKEDGVKLFNLRQETEPLRREVDLLLQAKAEQALQKGHLELESARVDAAVLAKIYKVDPKKFVEIFWNTFDAKPEHAKEIFSHMDIEQANAILEKKGARTTKQLAPFLLPRLAQLEVSRDIGRAEQTRFRGDDEIGKFQNEALKEAFIPILTPVLQSVVEETVIRNTKIKEIRGQIESATKERSAATDAFAEKDASLKEAQKKYKQGSAELTRATSEWEAAKAKRDASESRVNSLTAELKSMQREAAVTALKMLHSAIQNIDSKQLPPEVKEFLRTAVNMCEANGLKDGDRQATCILFLRIINPLLTKPTDIDMTYKGEDMLNFTKTGGGIGVVLQSLATRQELDPPLQALFDDISRKLQFVE